MNLASAASMSRASWVDVLPAAGRSSTSGVVILPSGRTGTDIDTSGLRHTMILIASPGPIRYSGFTASVEGSAGRLLAQPPRMNRQLIATAWAARLILGVMFVLTSKSSGWHGA